MFDHLIGRYVRHLNQRLMTFGASSGDVLLPAPTGDRQYLLYLHIPFCVVLCPFCSFHRVEFQEDRATQYFNALGQEVEFADELGYRFRELYVGGGTPTVLPDLLADLIEGVSARHPLDAVSVETNPHDLDKKTMTRLRAAGVNRLSVGVQSFNDRLLKEMQRYDTYGSGEEIISHLGRAAGTFDTLNVDMIFNFPHQSLEDLRTDLDILTDRLSVDQVSWYPLMSSASTRRPMARHMGRVDHNQERAYYETIAAHMRAAGYQRSSAWCFSRKPGMFDEYIVENEEYLGLGSGSFSYLDGSMYANTFSINNYLKRIGDSKTSAVRCRALTPPEQMRYFLLMQLFGGELDLAAAERRFDGQFDKTLWRDLAGLRLIGAVRTDGSILRLTESGNYLWVVLMREFFSGINSFRDDMRHHIASEAGRRPQHFG